MMVGICLHVYSKWYSRFVVSVRRLLRLLFQVLVFHSRLMRVFILFARFSRHRGNVNRISMSIFHNLGTYRYITVETYEHAIPIMFKIVRIGVSIMKNYVFFFNELLLVMLYTMSTVEVSI